MEKEQMKKKLKTMLSGDRYAHSIGVCETAVRLAKMYGADADKAYTAGLLHDAAKNLGKKEMLSECERLGVELDAVQRANIALVHAVLGAEYIKEQFGVEDEEIVSAVRYHTTGKADMTLLERIIYIADMIEPHRAFDGVDELRRAAEKDIDEACMLGLSQTIGFTLKKGGLIHEDTIHARNWLIVNKKPR